MITWWQKRVINQREEAGLEKAIFDLAMGVCSVGA